MRLARASQPYRLSEILLISFLFYPLLNLSGFANSSVLLIFYKYYFVLYFFFTPKKRDVTVFLACKLLILH